MKRLFTFFAIIALALAFSIPAYAVDASENYGIEEAEGSTPQKAESDTATDASASVGELADDESTLDTKPSENVFAVLYEKVSDNIGEILTALSLVLTALLSFAYKKGLIPVMTNSLSAIGGAISTIKESTEHEACELGKKGEQMLAAADLAQKTVNTLERKLTELDERLSLINGVERTQQATKIILGCQVDTLAEIFSSSALPEYKKEELCRRIADMKEALADVERENN